MTKCPVCELELLGTGSLIHHVFFKHLSKQPTREKFCWCGMKVTSKAAFMRHLDVHAVGAHTTDRIERHLHDCVMGAWK